MFVLATAPQAAEVLADGINTAPGTTCGTGLTCTAGTVTNNQTDHISWSTGQLSSVNTVKTLFYQFTKASTVDNLEVSANNFTCSTNPTITFFECGTSKTCSSSPVVIGTGTITTAGAVVDGSVSSGSISSGDYVAFAFTVGSCTALSASATVQAHQN